MTAGVRHRAPVSRLRLASEGLTEPFQALFVHLRVGQFWSSIKAAASS